MGRVRAQVTPTSSVGKGEISLASASQRFALTPLFDSLGPACVFDCTLRDITSSVKSLGKTPGQTTLHWLVSFFVNTLREQRWNGRRYYGSPHCDDETTMFCLCEAYLTEQLTRFPVGFGAIQRLRLSQ